MSTKDFSNIDKLLLGEIYTSKEAWNNLLTLCDECGSRFMGTEEEIKARNFVRRSMKSSGLDNVHLESFDYLAWVRNPRGANLKLLSPRETELSTISLPYCPSTPRGGLVANAVDAGDGTPEEFERLGKRAEGNMVMVTNRTPAYFGRRLHRKEKFGRILNAGASAFIYVNMSDGRLQETGALCFNQEAPIPGVSISKEDYTWMQRLSAKGKLKMKLVTRDSTHPAKGNNVVGELKGTSGSDEMIVVGAHYDGHDISVGAGDNANGAAVLLEIARVLALVRKHIKTTVRFISFSAEEFGLIGARADVARHEEELDSIRLMLNIDGIQPAMPKGLLFHRWNGMQLYVAKLAKDMGYPIPTGSR
ncbi:MAG: M28 family peptidase, partial [Planctomycetota bacterium]|nr:M28 family peptidase [Planctomycetota bacterium]